MKRLIMAALPAAVLLAACHTHGEKAAGKLNALDQKFQAAYKAGDVDTLVAIYTEDARLMAPNMPMAQGSAAIRDAFAGMIHDGLGLELTVTDSIAGQGVGYNVGTYVVTAPDGTHLDSGKYVETWRKVGEDWRMSNDIWNSDLPAIQGPLVVATHELKDRAAWLAAWQDSPERRAQFAANGAAGVRLIQSADDENLAGIVVEASNLDALRSFLASPEAGASAAADGLAVPTLRFFYEIR